MTPVRWRSLACITILVAALPFRAEAQVVMNEVRSRPAESPQSATSTATLSLPHNAQGGVGADIQVSISVAPADGIYSIDTTFNYDPAIIEAVGVTTSGLGLAAGFSTFSNLNTPGQVLISAFANSNPLSGSGEFARIQFHVVGAPSTTSALTFVSGSINENNIVAGFDSGVFSVTCAGSLNGTPCSDGNSCTVNDSCQANACAPGTPIPPPAELAGVAIAANKSSVSWTPASGVGVVYDVVRGLVFQLPAGGGAAETCLASGTSATSIVDAATPAAQTAFWYLTRARTTCGTGTYGSIELHGVPTAQRNPTACP